jgi:cell division protease FtsH
MADDKKTMTDLMKSPQWRIVSAVLIFLLFMYLWNMFFRIGTPEYHTIGYSQFLEQLNAGNIHSVIIKELQLTGSLVKETPIQLSDEKSTAPVKKFHTFLPSFQGEDLIKKLQEKNVLIAVEPSEKGSFLWQILIGVLPWILIIGIWILLMRRAQQIQGGPGGLFTFGASKAKLFDAKKVSVTFKDVAGMNKVKQELK